MHNGLGFRDGYCLGELSVCAVKWRTRLPHLKGSERVFFNSLLANQGETHMFYSNGNYEAFIRPRKPQGVDGKSAHLIGGGIASLTAAGFLIRDGQMDAKRITIYEASNICGGCLDGIKDPKEGYLFRGEREMEDHYECLWDLMRSIPSLDVKGASVLEDYYQVNKDYPNYSLCRTTHKRGQPLPMEGKMLLTPKAQGELMKLFYIVALIGGPILIWRAVTAHWAAQAARNQAETGREAHFTSLFTKAVEQLGATREATKTFQPDSPVTPDAPRTVTETEPNLEVRLGAIYALERIAQDSERDHWPIMEVLCSYIRNPQNCGVAIVRPDKVFPSSIPIPPSSAYLEWLASIREPRVDIQAAVSVLARRAPIRVRHEQARGAHLDFRGANLQRAGFAGGSFEDAMFYEAHLDSASFMNADLRRASFALAHLERAMLNGSLGSGLTI